jgi:hypothetical protein
VGVRRRPPRVALTVVKTVVSLVVAHPPFGAPTVVILRRSSVR